MMAQSADCVSYPPVDRVVNIHDGLPQPPHIIKSAIVKGTYGYWHYGCDGVDDRVGFLDI